MATVPIEFSSPQTKLKNTSSSKQVVLGVVAGNGSSGGSATVKSKTLPEGSYLRHGKHQRSLSESKTTDVISLISSGTGGGAPTTTCSGLYPSHRTRYNSCTDSNTSGVSSCESVTGRAAAMG